jgi:tRNA-2-methylthio-N6-dimethylallyladenosine synthase
VGFPTETKGEFEETLEVMREVRFCSAFSFKYSPRPHTTAQSHYRGEDLVSPEVAGQRLLCLQELQDELSLEFNSAFLGKTLEVLVEGQDKKISSSGRGRIPQNTLVEIANCQASVGDLPAVVISQATPHGLRGECA